MDKLLNTSHLVCVITELVQNFIIAQGYVLYTTLNK